MTTYAYEPGPVIASMRDERDVEHPTVEVPALDVFLVEDGDVMDAEHVRSGPWCCFCDDKRHRDIDRRPLEFDNSYLPKGAHLLTVHTYAVVTEMHMTTKTDIPATPEAAVDQERWTTCGCPDGEHVDPKALTRSHALQLDADIIARHTGRHVVPVSAIRTEVAA